MLTPDNISQIMIGTIGAVSTLIVGMGVPALLIGRREAKESPVEALKKATEANTLAMHSQNVHFKENNDMFKIMSAAVAKMAADIEAVKDLTTQNVAVQQRMLEESIRQGIRPVPRARVTK